jgi:hypothetical protein
LHWTGKTGRAMPITRRGRPGWAAMPGATRTAKRLPRAGSTRNRAERSGEPGAANPTVVGLLVPAVQPACPTLHDFDLGYWYAAFAGAGHPRIAYDSDHQQGGACGTFTDAKLTRFALFNQP